MESTPAPAAPEIPRPALTDFDSAVSEPPLPATGALDGRPLESGPWSLRPRTAGWPELRLAMALVQDPTRNSPTANRRITGLPMARVAARHTEKKKRKRSVDKSSAR